MFIAAGAEDVAKFFGESIIQSFVKVCLAIDFVVYNLISWLYTVFITIAKARLFTTETIKPFLDRVYLIIGIVALFFAAYTFLTIIANPDNLTKGNTAPSKLIRNILLGIIAITFTPTIFNFAYSVQGSVLDQNIIAKIFMTRNEQLMDDSEQSLSEFSVSLFEASFYVKNQDSSTSQNNGVSKLYSDAHNNAVKYHDVSWFSTCASGVATGEIQYNFILAGVIGIIVAYVFLVYCFDLGLRAVKLTFLQIIAPLPALLLMVPGQDKMFKTWLKDTLKTFFEVFLKIFIVVFCVYIVQLLRQWFNVNQDLIFPGVSLTVINFAKLFIFLGVIMFMKKAPKLIEDLFGFKVEPGSFSLKKRLQESGVSTAFDKTVGMAGSMAASYYSNRKGAEARLKTDAKYLNASAAEKKRMLNKATGVGGALTMGAFLGARGGIGAIGTAYNTGFDTQRDKANHLKKSEMALNYARGYLGMESRYEELNELDKIKTDAEDYRDRRQYQRDEAAVMGIKQNTDNKYDPSIKATEKFESSYKGVMDHADDETKKSSSSINRSVVQPRYVKYDDASSNLTVSSGTYAGKNASQLINEGRKLDSQIATQEADIVKFKQQQQVIEQQRAAAASAGRFGQANEFEVQYSDLDAKIKSAQSLIATAKSNKNQIQLDLGQLAAKGGEIEYSVVSGWNRDAIEKNRDNLISELQKQGASAQAASEAFSIVNTGKRLDGSAVDFKVLLNNSNIDQRDKKYFVNVDADDIFTYKDAAGSIVREYLDISTNTSNANYKADTKLNELLVTTTAAAQNTNAGVDVSTGGLIFDVSDYTNGDLANGGDIESFVSFFDDNVKGSTARIQSNKKIEFNNATIEPGMDYEVLEDGTEIVRPTPRNVNVVLDEMDVIKPRSEARVKAHETFAKQYIGLKEASEAAKKRMDVFKASKNKRGNGH